MKTSSCGSRLGVMLAVVAFVSCKEDGFGDVPADEAPSTYADVLCGQADSCGCFDALPTTGEACKSQLELQLQHLLDMGEAAGLTYDGKCIGESLDLVSALGCRTSWDEVGADLDIRECSYCKIFHGGARVDEPCTTSQGYGLGDECAQGLICANERCVDPCARVGEGGDCTNTSCDEGLYCAWDWDPETEDMSATCVRAAGQGEDCSEARCDDELECDFETTTCVPRPPPPGPGEPCTGVCAETAYCDTTDLEPGNWVCVAKKGDGEACESDQECSSWTCEEGTCLAEGPLVCMFGF
jgi:hypothetical protein